MGCSEPPLTGDGAPHQCPLDELASIYADVRAILMVLLVFKGRKAPTEVTATGILHKTGADVQGSVALKFSATETATVNYTIRGETPEIVTFIGTKGRIEICTPAHAPTAVKITRATGGRGGMETQTFDFPLPVSDNAVSRGHAYTQTCCPPAPLPTKMCSKGIGWRCFVSLVEVGVGC